MTAKTAKGVYEPIVWVGVALLIAGIAFALFTLLTFRTGFLFIWLNNSVYRFLALIPAVLAILPLINSIRSKVPGCLRNSAIFLSLTLIIPCAVLGLAVIVIVYRRGFAHSTKTFAANGNAAGSQIRFSLVKNCEADAFDAFPRSILYVNVEETLVALEERGYSRILGDCAERVVQKDGVESTISPSGRITIKSTDETFASNAAAEIYETMVFMNL